MKTKTQPLTLACKFSGVSIGDETAKITLAIERKDLNILAADEALCGKRVAGTIVLGNHDPDQARLLDDAEVKITTSFAVPSMRVGRKLISVGLTMDLSEIETADLAEFAYRSGALVVEHSAELEETRGRKRGSDDQEEADEED